MSVLSGEIGDCCGFLDRATELVPDASDPALPAYINIVRALELISDGESERGAELARAVLADPNADPICRSWARLDLEMVAFFAGDLATCLEVSTEAVGACETAGESWSRVPHLHAQAIATWRLGDPVRARSLLLDALQIDRRLDDVWHRAWSIEALGWVTADLGRDVRAARLLGTAQACWAYTGSSITPPWQVYRDAVLATLRRRMGDERLDHEVAAGRSIERSRAISYALEDGPGDGAEPGEPAAAPRVSSRELEVAALVAEGLPNRAIGERLFVSPRTVETHVQHLMDKLGVGSRAEIAAWHARISVGPQSG
jgi:non-specific serine/threonine protein kinase